MYVFIILHNKTRIVHPLRIQITKLNGRFTNKDQITQLIQPHSNSLHINYQELEELVKITTQ